MIKSIYLRKGKEESLNRFHPWVFSGAVHHIDGELEEGDLVNVFASDGRFIAKGHWQIGSIAVRVLAFEDCEIDDSFWCNRIRIAYDVRKRIGVAGVPTNDIYRLVHGEGDNLPGLIVDMYGTTAVMQAHSVGMHHCRMEIAKALREVMGGIAVYYKSETTLPYKASLPDQLPWHS